MVRGSGGHPSGQGWACVSLARATVRGCGRSWARALGKQGGYRVGRQGPHRTLGNGGR